MNHPIPDNSERAAARRSRRSAWGRALVRCTFFLAAAACVLPVLPWREAELILPALSPYIALCGLAARHTVGDLLLGLALPATALVMLRKRWLCRFVCPVGLLNDQAARLRPGARGRYAHLPHLGRWFALVTLGGAAVGYPLLLWLDPFSIFNGALGAFRRPVTVASALPAVVLLAILLVSALWPGLWCMRLCPLGATQELLALPRQWLLRLRRRANPAASPAPGPGGMPLARRSALALALGGAWAWAGRKAARPAEDAAVPILPPGAAPRGQFHGLCVRCGNCVRVCPTKIIQPDLGGRGLAAFMAPELSFEFDYCHPDCHECTKVCPSGAIARLSLAQKRRAVIGLAKISHETCLAAQGGECNACTMACLYDAIGGTGEPTAGNLSAAPVVSAKRCVGCGACELVCPVPGKAVSILANRR